MAYNQNHIKKAFEKRQQFFTALINLYLFKIFLAIYTKSKSKHAQLMFHLL